MAIRLSDQIVRRLSVGSPTDVTYSPNTSYLFYVAGTTYTKGVATHDGNIVPGANNAISLGLSDKAFTKVYSNGITVNSASSSTAGGISLYGTDSQITNYGIAMRAGATHGYIWNDGTHNGTDWNINFYNNSNGGNTNRGWKFMMDGTAIASINGIGAAYLNKALWVEQTQIHPLGGEYHNNASNQTGYILITLPPRAALACMLSFDIVVDNYVHGNAATYHIYGYCYNGSGNASWAGAFSAWSDGPVGAASANLTVRAWADNDTKTYYLSIGEANTAWQYPQISIQNVHLGFSNASSSEWKRPWTIALSTAAFPSSVNYTVSNPLAKRVKVEAIAGANEYLMYFAGTTGNSKTSDTLGYDTAFTFNPDLNRITLVHQNGKSGEYHVTYGSTVDMWMGIGSGNVNHGLYDAKAGKWMVWADGSGNVTLEGNALTANNAINATYLKGAADQAAAITTASGTALIRYSYNVNNGTTGLFPTNNNANGILNINRHSGNYNSQLGFSANGNIYYRSTNGSALNTTDTWQQILFKSQVGSAAFTDSSLYVQIYTYSIPAGAGVRIQYPTYAPTIVGVNRANSGGQLLLAGSGYGAGGTVRNAWREIVSSAESMFTWTIPSSDSISNSIEVMNHNTSGAATVMVWAKAAPTFTSITALSNDAMNHVSIHSKNYTTYTVTKTGGGASGTWGISITGNAATATKLASTPNLTTVFLRGDNTWTNILKQAAGGALGIDTNLKIGTLQRDLNFDIPNGSGTGINDGNAGGITFGNSGSAYAGLYYQTSGAYGSRLILATTSSYANGAYARMIITHVGNIGINTLTPSYKLHLMGGQTLLDNTTASSTTNQSAQLMISNSNGGNVALELWRNGNASWQIANEGGVLFFRNNWTTAKQTTYTQSAIQIDYNTGITQILGTTDTASTSTGVLQVKGGLAVTKGIWAGGFVKSAGITSDTNTNNGAIHPAITIYPSNSNEINFGGYYTSNRNIYFGYRKINDREIPIAYYFGPYSQAILFVGEVAAGTVKETYLQLGNATDKSAANNGRGRIRLYGTNTFYNDIIPTDNTAHTTYYLPYSNTALGSSVTLVGAWNKATSSSAPFSLNNVYDSGFYNFTGGYATDNPRNYGYGSLLVVAYRKPYGNTTPDWGWQMYHDASANNRLWFRTSASAGAWAEWQEIAHAKTNTQVGSATQPVYMAQNGVITGTTYSLGAQTNPGTANYVAYYSGANQISAANTTTAMIMPSHYYHTMYSNATTGTDVYVHYYNGSVTAENTNANFRVKKGTSYNTFRLVGGGAASWDGGNIYASAGYLVQKSNSNTLTIGSQNSSWVHFSSDQNRPFYFNRTTHIDGNMNPYTSKTGGSLGTTSYLWNGAYLYKALYIVGNQATDNSTYMMFYASDNTERARISHNGNTDNAKNSGTYMQLKTSYGDIRLAPASASVRVAGTLDIWPSTGSYTEGIRIYPYGSWATIMLLGTDHNNATSSYTANSWGIYNNNGTFWISRAQSAASGTYAFGHNGTNWIVKGHLVPHATNTYTLGTSALRWKALYIGTADSYGASNHPIYWNAGVPAAATVGDSFVSYGGQNFVGNFSPIDALYNNRLRANRFAGFNPNGITIQYSSDGGSTWTDSTAITAASKKALLTTSTSLRLVESGNVSANSQLRIILDTGVGGVYTTLKKIMIYVSTNYSNGSKVTIDAALQNAPTNYTKTICTDQDISGWSGWNVINCDFTTYGNTATSQYGRIRFTFKHTSITSGREANGLIVQCIYGYGGVGWTAPSTLAYTDHVYSFDQDFNVTFPAALTVTGKVTANGGIADYNNGTPTKFGYSTTGLAYNGTSWIAAWDTSVSGEYRLRAINAANLRQFLFGTSKIGDTNKPVYYDGSTLAALTSTVGSGIIPTYLASGTITASTASVGSARQPVYLNGGTITAANLTVRHWPNAGASNMNTVARQHASVGMTNLTANTTDNPVNGTTGASGWHLYWDASYTDDPNGSNAWVAQIANTAGTNRWFVRSRNGGTITDGTAWAGPWRHLVTSTAAAVGSNTKAAYINAYGEATAVDYELKATVNNGTSTALAYYSGANTISSEPRIRQHRSNRYPLDFTLHNDAGSTVAEFWYDAGNTTNVTAGSWRFRAYSPADPVGTATAGFYEDFYLPTVTSARTANASYNILTTKATVTTGQGGTGNTSYTANRLLYTESATKFASATSIYASTTAITINGTSAPANSGNFQVIGTSTLRHVYPQSAASYNLGTTDLTWNHMYFQGTLYQKMTSDTSNYKAAITWQNPTVTTESYPAQIGWHNTGESINIVPYAQSTSPWGRTVGLSVGKSTLLYNNRRVVTGISVGSTTQPVYIDGNGYAQTCTAYTDLFTALSWTAGTTAGPTLSATIGGTTKTATIPSAASGASGIVTTGAQTFAGAKTFSGGIHTPWIEMSSATPYIDFHHGSDTADYTFRLITKSDGLALTSKSGTNCWLYLGNGTNQAGVYWQTFGGGWYMSDTTWIRTYGSKSVYMNAGTFRCDGTIQAGSSGTYKWENTGNIIVNHAKATSTGSSWLDGQRYENGGFNLTDATNTGSYWPWMRQTNTGSAKWFSFGILNTTFRMMGSSTSRTENNYDYGLIFDVATGYLTGATRVYNSVWNDYAEYRKADITTPGYVIAPGADGIAHLTTKRLQPGARVISDTYGSAVGQSDQANTPVGLAGRVLARPYQLKANYHIGDCVCSAPGGTVDIMTREEIMMYPECILGIVNEIPTYEVWEQQHTTDDGHCTKQSLNVDGRIWIDLK